MSELFLSNTQLEKLAILLVNKKRVRKTPSALTQPNRLKSAMKGKQFIGSSSRVAGAAKPLA